MRLNFFFCCLFHSCGVLEFRSRSLAFFFWSFFLEASERASMVSELMR